MAQPNPFDQFDKPAGNPFDVFHNGLKPQEGYHRVSPTAVAPDAGSSADPSVIARNKSIETGIETGAQKQLIGVRTAAEIQAARAKAAIENAAAMDKLQKEREFKLQQTPQQRAMANLSNDEVLTAIQQARDEINKGWAAGLPTAVMSHIPGSNAKDLAGSLNTIKGNLTLDNLQKLKAASTTGASGMGSLTEKEGELLASTVGSLDQSQSPEKLLDSLGKIESHYRRWNALNNGEDPNNSEVAKRYGIAALPGSPGGQGGPGVTPSGGDPMGLSQNGTQTVIDPALAGVNQKVASLIKGGATAGEVRGYLDSIQPGLGARSANIDQWVQFHKQNPSRPINVMLDRKEVPLSAVPAFVNKAAQSPFGAYAMSAGDALTAGTMDNMTANPALARAGMAGVQAQNPTSSLAGTVTGGAMAGAGLEAVLAKLGVPAMTAAGQAAVAAGEKAPWSASVFAPSSMAADLGYGAAYGAGSNDSNRLAGAVSGGLTSAGGGVFGRGLARTAGTVGTGITDKGKQYLAQSGIPMTIGQTIGGAAKSFEDRLAGYPLIGDAINARRKEGVQSFNRAALNEALAPIGQTAGGQIGEAGINNANDAISQAYQNALAGQLVRTDLPYKQAMASLPQQIASIPRVGPELAGAIDKTVSPMFGQGGTLTGQDMQAVVRGLQQLKAGYKNDPLFATDIAPAIDAVHGNIRGMFERQAPDVLPAYDAANQAYGKFATVRDAVNSAVNTDGTFSPAQLGLADRKGTMAFGGKTAAASGDRRFFDLQRAGQNVLPSKIPDSGTAGRMAIPLAAGLLTGGGNYAADGKNASGSDSLGLGLLAAAAAAAPYSKAGQGMFAKSLMAKRPAGINNIGQFLKDYAKVGGYLGDPLALQYYGVAGPQ